MDLGTLYGCAHRRWRAMARQRMFPAYGVTVKLASSRRANCHRSTRCSVLARLPACCQRHRRKVPGSQGQRKPASIHRLESDPGKALEAAHGLFNAGAQIAHITLDDLCSGATSAICHCYSCSYQLLCAFAIRITQGEVWAATKSLCYSRIACRSVRIRKERGRRSARRCSAR